MEYHKNRVLEDPILAETLSKQGGAPITQGP